MDQAVIEKTGLEQVIPNYLDVGDNVHANVCDWLEANCGDSEHQWFIPGTCKNGHRIAKIIACGKEWCPVCGQKNSIAHNRRFVRWLTKIQQFKQMRYVVLTIPEHLRSQYRTKADLRELGRRAQRLMQDLGYNRGLRRWHWFGDRSHKWHPHLNILVEGGYMPAEKLSALKQGWADILGADVISAKVTYKRNASNMAGSLNYITRATFLDYNWDIDMALELRNFRSMVVWGRDWNNEPAWELSVAERQTMTGEVLNVEAIEDIVNHVCPKCHTTITWDTALPARLLRYVDKISYGAGYYSLTDRASPPRLPDDNHDKNRADWHNALLSIKKERIRLHEIKQKEWLEKHQKLKY